MKLTPYQKMMLKLLIMIWWSITQAPGVARYDHDKKYVEDLEKRYKL